MSEPKFVGRNVVLQLANSVLVLKRVKTEKRKETVEYVAFDCDTLETIGAYTKETLQDMLENREWESKLAEREARKSSTSTIASVLDDDSEPDDEESKQFGQQPPL